MRGEGLNGEDYFERKDLRKYDLFSQYAIAAVDEAVSDAGLDFRHLATSKEVSLA
jgi:3-oxoacyl-[acyl-carrier-protein] synthase II